MILVTALTVADYGSTIVNSKCFAGGGAVQRTQRSDRLISRKDEGQKIPVPVLAVADDLARIIDGAGSINLPAQRAHIGDRLIRRGIEKALIIFSLKTVTDDFAFIIYSERCAIGTLRRWNP